MFGLFKQKVNKRDYGSIIATNAMQYLDEVSRGVDSILKANFEIVKDELVADTDISKMFSLQLASCLAVGELTFYSMEKSGLSVYESREGLIDHIETLIKTVNEKHGIQLSINPLKISQDIANIISKNDFLSKTGKFYSDEGFSDKDVYGQVSVYLFELSLIDYPEFKKLIFESISLNGALQLVMGIDRAFRFVSEMYKSYKLV